MSEFFGLLHMTAVHIEEVIDFKTDLRFSLLELFSTARKFYLFLHDKESFRDFPNPKQTSGTPLKRSSEID